MGFDLVSECYHAVVCISVFFFFFFSFSTLSSNRLTKTVRFQQECVVVSGLIGSKFKPNNDTDTFLIQAVAGQTVMSKDNGNYEQLFYNHIFTGDS